MENCSKIQILLNKLIKDDKVITQKELATKMGVSAVAVNKWLNGGSIDADKIPQLCKILSISPNDLFGFNSDEDTEILNIIHSDPELKQFVLSRRTK